MNSDLRQGIKLSWPRYDLDNKMKPLIWVVYPFTSSTLGAQDNYFIKCNLTNAFFVALRRLRNETGAEVEALFMTERPEPQTSVEKGITFRFLNANNSPLGDHRVFGKQWSLSMLLALVRDRPTLIFLFIGGGWFAVTLALICKTLGIPYCPIIASRGISTRRSLRWYYRNALRTIVHTEGHKSRFSQAGID